MSDPNENLVVPIFKTHTTHNEAASKAKGRPIFDDIEVVEIRMAANKQTVGVFPAHEVWKYTDQPDGSREPTTYAMRWAEQYRKFKSNEAQVQSGTPLSELPFLTQAKRMELKALNIHTAEALAALDGTPLKQFGVGGREMKTQAEAYLAKANGSAVETRLAAENNDLRQQIADLQAQFSQMNQKPGPVPEVAEEAGDDEPAEDVADEDEPAAVEAKEGSPFQDWDDDDIKLWIKEETGKSPTGNPKHATLVRMADEINEDLAKQAAAKGQ